MLVVSLAVFFIGLAYRLYKYFKDWTGASNAWPTNPIWPRA